MSSKWDLFSSKEEAPVEKKEKPKEKPKEEPKKIERKPLYTESEISTDEDLSKMTQRKAKWKQRAKIQQVLHHHHRETISKQNTTIQQMEQKQRQAHDTLMRARYSNPKSGRYF